MVVLALLLAATNQIFQFIDPLIARKLVDDYALRSGDYTSNEFLRGVLVLVAAAVGVSVISRIALALQNYCVGVVTKKVGADIYTDGVQHSLELPYALFEDQRSGVTLMKLEKVRTDVERFITAAVNTLFTTIVGLSFITVYAFSVHWLIAPAFFITVPLMAVMSSVLSRRIKQIQKSIVGETTALAGSTTESLRNIELVKSLGLARQEIRRLNDTTRKIVKLELRKVRSLRVLGFIQAITLVALRTLVLFLMIYLIYKQRLTIGEWLSFWLYSFFIFGPLAEVGTVIHTYRETEASLENFKEIMATPVEATPAQPLRVGPLESLAFEDVKFTYAAASVPSLAGVSFHAELGETVAFVGPSGSGKTTLVKLLVGLYAPHEGRILYNGIPGTSIELDELRDQIGFVTQDTQLFSGSIRENLLFVNPEATDEECLSVLKQASCETLLLRGDRGLDTLIGEQGMKISGGEKQRLSIARALLRRPRLLVFDEATSSLDSLTEDEVTATVREVASKDVMTIVIAHRLSTVIHADRIHVLERGRIIESGRHRDLLDRKGLYYAMWRQQVGERPADEENRILAAAGSGG
jgi:ATP-binding cassette, subfamily B, bacterial